MTHTFILHIMRRRRMRIQTGCHCAAPWSQLDPIVLHPLCLQCFQPPTGMPPTSTSFPCTFPYTFPYFVQLLGLNLILSSFTHCASILPLECHPQQQVLPFHVPFIFHVYPTDPILLLPFCHWNTTHLLYMYHLHDTPFGTRLV